MAERFETPLEHEFGLVLARGDRADDVLVETGRQAVRLDVGDEAVLVATID